MASIRPVARQLEHVPLADRPRLARHNATRAPVRLTPRDERLVAAPTLLARSSPRASRRAPPRAARSRSPRRVGARTAGLGIAPPPPTILLVHDPGRPRPPASRSSSPRRPRASTSSPATTASAAFCSASRLSSVLRYLWTQFGVHGVLGAARVSGEPRARFSDTDLDVVFIEPGADDSTALDVDTESSGDNKPRAVARTSGASRA